MDKKIILKKDKDGEMYLIKRNNKWYIGESNRWITKCYEELGFT